MKKKPEEEGIIKKLIEALEDIEIRSKRIQEDKAVVGIEAGFIRQIARSAIKKAKETP